MEAFNSNLFISLSVALIYFGLKYTTEKEKDKKKLLFKDSILVGLITYAVLMLRNNFTQIGVARTTVFTNEPQF